MTLCKVKSTTLFTLCMRYIFVCTSQFTHLYIMTNQSCRIESVHTSLYPDKSVVQNWFGLLKQKESFQCFPKNHFTRAGIYMSKIVGTSIKKVISLFSSRYLQISWQVKVLWKEMSCSLVSGENVIKIIQLLCLILIWFWFQLLTWKRVGETQDRYNPSIWEKL